MIDEATPLGSLVVRKAQRKPGCVKRQVGMCFN
jgi:hypothetical protein